MDEKKRETRDTFSSLTLHSKVAMSFKSVPGTESKASHSYFWFWFNKDLGWVEKSNR